MNSWSFLARSDPRSALSWRRKTKNHVAIAPSVTKRNHEYLRIGLAWKLQESN
jgi:hypothetical protein